MAKNKPYRLKKIAKISLFVLDVGLIFVWAFWNTGVLTDGPYVDPGDQLQFALVVTGLVIFGYLIASMMRRNPESLARPLTIVAGNVLVVPVFMAMISCRGGMATVIDWLYFGVVPFGLSIAVLYAYSVLEEK